MANNIVKILLMVSVLPKDTLTCDSGIWIQNIYKIYSDLPVLNIMCIFQHSPVFVFGTGVTMKLMDEVAGIVAARHCNTNIVTASVDAINFHRKIKKGCVLTVTGRLTFVSNKSMEIEVFVDAASLVEAEKGRYRAVSAYFTFISLDKYNRPLPVTPLKVACVRTFCLCILLQLKTSKLVHMQGKGKLV
uniref:Acyl-CoA thioesterase 7 n=1 Tax=Labrus bergylta TaxID=56723 RepID=A0A3Q3FXW3_9LABR